MHVWCQVKLVLPNVSERRSFPILVLPVAVELGHLIIILEFEDLGVVQNLVDHVAGGENVSL